MKVWISLCLIWLAVRAVSAQEPISREHGPYDFSRIDLALEYVERVSTNNDEEQHVKAGDAIYIEPERVQWIENSGKSPLQFIAIVNPPWTDEGDNRL